uniref:UspA domain-containing protein n=1 Tax=Lotharella oceanica TaxID=641309 RepID=A0A7S2THU5_9EUKA|mmetsp:Transcript_14846/g.28240  ORF Transcript_14846/g.28240 Transcript_14846/m.28240 type:complete len:182 (+) Transcript_14846:53-598(+)
MAATAENHAMEGKGSGRHVMLALDESKYAEDVLRFCAENFAKIKGNKITFLYVYEYTPMTLLPGPGFVPAGQNVEDLNEDIRKHAIDKGTKILKHLGKKAQVLGFKPDDMKLLVGAPASNVKRAIVDYTKTEKADVLLCGSRGMGAVGRVFLGSVSDYLVHNCDCSVVIVKHPKEEPKSGT